MNFFKKSVIEIVGYIFFSFVIVIIAAFFFVSSCLASSYEQGFEDYTNGTLINTIPNWETSRNSYISSDQAYAGTKSAVVESNGYSATYSIATSTDLQYVRFAIYLDDLIYSGLTSYFSFGTSSNFMIAWDYTGGEWDNNAMYSISNAEGSGPVEYGFLKALSDDTWYEVVMYQDYRGYWNIEIDGDLLHTYQYDISPADLMVFMGNAGGFGHKRYIDYFLASDIPIENETSLDNYDFTLSEVEPDFSTVANQICFLGVECRLYFSFNQLAIGYPMYLFNYEDSNFPGNEIASTTVTATPIWQNYVIVPDQATSTELKYNFLLDAGEYGWIVKTGIKINWWSEAEWQAYLDDIGPEIDEYCSAENVCENVATSSDFLYGVQCGFQQGVCWMLVPNSSSKNFFFNTVTKFESSFPFNFYFTIVNQAKSNLQESASSDASLDFPMYSTSTGEVSWQPLISSSTVTDIWNDDTYDLTNNIFTWAWWLLVIFAITYLVYRQMI